MLCELRIQNLALINALELHFDDNGVNGLIVMTGETGAGKSIMLRALHLLTGGRASADWIRTGADSCTIEALFEIHSDNEALRARLQESGYGTDSALVIKRVITAAGRSKLYVNGSIATARAVAEVTGEMLTIASQHDHQRLLQPGLHLKFLDTYGELDVDRQEFATLYTLWQEKKQDLAALKKQEADKEQRRDFLSFQLSEIEKAGPQPGEDEELVAEKKRLKSADALIQLSQESYYLLSTEIVDGLSTLRKNMEHLVSLDPQAEKLAEQVINFAYSAEDQVAGLRQYRDALESNPLRLEQVTERLDILQGLKRKYGQDLEQVLSFAVEARAELTMLDNMERDISALEAELEIQEQRLCAAASQLSEKRRKVADQMEKKMAQELSSLAFQRSGFIVQWAETEQSTENLNASGWDRVEFYFSANAGEPPRPLIKVASGGELSRLMLAMKCLLAKKDMVDTVIFDEVDAGIGGEAAEAVARKIKELAGHHQVFCITHLPQIAARGSLHFQVSKMVEDGRTSSIVNRLSNSSRVQELARMLAGDSVTEQTRAWAKELLAKGSLLEV